MTNEFLNLGNYIIVYLIVYLERQVFCYRFSYRLWEIKCKMPCLMHEY